MKNILKHEIRMCFSIKMIAGLFALILIFILLPIGGSSFQKMQLLASNIVPLIIIYISTILMSAEFEYNTYKVTFTGRFTRIQILCMKFLAGIIMAVLMAGFICIMFKITSAYSGVEFILLDALSVLACLVLFMLLVSAVSFLTAIICKNFIGTFFVLFALFFDFFNRCLILAAGSIRNEGLKSFLMNIPLYDALNGLQMFSYSGRVIINMLIASVISIVIAVVILQKRDLS